MRSVIKNLRRKLRDDAERPAYIFNEARVGYRMPKGETVETGKGLRREAGRQKMLGLHVLGEAGRQRANSSRSGNSSSAGTMKERCRSS